MNLVQIWCESGVNLVQIWCRSDLSHLTDRWCFSDGSLKSLVVCLKSLLVSKVFGCLSKVSKVSSGLCWSLLVYCSLSGSLLVPEAVKSRWRVYRHFLCLLSVFTDDQRKMLEFSKDLSLSPLDLSVSMFRVFKETSRPPLDLWTV